MKQVRHLRLCVAAAVAVLCAVPLATAQTTKPTPVAATARAATAPAISDSLRAEFFKAQSQMIQSAAQAKDTQEKFQATIAQMQQTCGQTATLRMNQAGDPVCVVKATEPKK